MQLIVANLDCERHYAQTRLPAHRQLRKLTKVAQDKMLLRSLALAAFAHESQALLWTPCPLPDSWLGPHFPQGIRLVSGPINRYLPGASHLDYWAVTEDIEDHPGVLCSKAIAQNVNDRSFCHTLRTELDLLLPGSQIVGSLKQLMVTVAKPSSFESWVAKAPHSASGQMRMKRRYGEVRPGDQRALSRMFELFGEILLEPWVERVEDYCCRGFVSEQGYHVLGQHKLRTSGLGSYESVSVSAGDMPLGIRLDTCRHVGRRLFELGYRGPYGVDGFVYNSAGNIIDYPLCEINARLSFGHLASKWMEQMNCSQLALGCGQLPTQASCLASAGNESLWYLSN